MTAVATRRPAAPVLALGAVPAGVGLTALLARPWFLPPGVGMGWRVAFFVALGGLGAAWPLTRGTWPERPGEREAWPERPGEREARAAGWRTSLGALGIGTLAFVAGRTLVDLPARPTALALAIGVNALAAVAEEAFFRRYLYGLLARFGPAVAVGGTAAAFAVAHVTVWGWWVLPLDLAAGLVLSWQRATTGRWSVPAATHVLANTLAFL